MSDVRSDDEFHNPSWGYVRIFLWIAGVALVAGLLPLAYVAAGGEGATTVPAENAILYERPPNPYAGAMVAGVLAGTIVVTMLICAFASVFPARAADRALAAFRRGEWLVRWDLPADRWAAHAEGESRRWHKTAAISVAIVFGTLALLGAFVGGAVPKSTENKVAIGGIAFVSFVALGWLTYALVGLLVDRRADRLAASPPRAYIGLTSVYCAGAFSFWGAQWRALHACRVEPPEAPGEPSRLVFEVGMTSGAREATKTMGMLMMLAGRSMGGAESNTQKQAVPIPPGQESAAQDLAARLLAGSE